MTMGAVAARYGVANACALALEAGADLVLMKAENALVGETFAKIRKFVEAGRIPEKELDQKVYRVLNTKYEYGLWTNFKRENPSQVVKDPGILGLSEYIARKSVMVEQGRDLPLSRVEKMLVIEQINKTPNNFYWHPGILYKNCLAYNTKCDYLETNYTFDDNDRAAITENVKKYETIGITNFYIRGKLANTAFVEELLHTYEDKKIIVITNTPYPISVPRGCRNLVVTYATSPANMAVAAGALFGGPAEAQYPIAWQGGEG
jgi:beta-N-acetylhexosaminidase